MKNKLLALAENEKFWKTVGVLAALLVPLVPASWHQEGDAVLPVIFAIIHAIGNAFPQGIA